MTEFTHRCLLPISSVKMRRKYRLFFRFPSYVFISFTESSKLLYSCLTTIMHIILFSTYNYYKLVSSGNSCKQWIVKNSKGLLICLSIVYTFNNIKLQRQKKKSISRGGGGCILQSRILNLSTIHLSVRLWRNTNMCPSE